MTETNHGGAGTAYSHYGCRCDECRAANAARKKRRDKERARLLAAGLVNPTHGEVSTYSNYLCRCDECRAAWSERCRRYKADRRRAEGLPA